MQVTRQYHSTALLLPDGRVLSSGGGICGTCDQVGYLAKNAEIFSPPYLFQADGTLAPRPAIDSAPASTSYGAPIRHRDRRTRRRSARSRSSGSAPSRTRTTWSSATSRCSFTAGATSLTATAPANANVAPPGFYMLFIVDANGVPSVARMVSVQRQLAADRHAHPAGERRDVHRARDREPRGDRVRRRRHGDEGRVLQRRDEARRGHDRAVQLHLERRAAGTYTLTARATDDLGATTTSAAATITVSATNTPPTAAITSPADGAMFAWKPTITLSATASDTDGQVTKVEFRDGTTVLGQDTTAPYSYTWRNVPWEPRADRARDRQRGRGDDQQPGQHHRASQTLRRRRRRL